MSQQFPILNDENRFDRLVDGELSAEQYRELLRSLEVDPDGWRRCAVAFLEAQAWGCEWSSTSGSIPSALPAGSSKTPAKWRRWAVAISMAACFLVAFGLGTGLRVWRPQPKLDLIAGSASATNSLETDANVRAPGLDEQPYDNTPAELAMSQSPNSELVSLPLYELGDDRAMQVLSHSALSRKARRSLEQLGYDVSEQRQFAAVQLSDGSRAFVPIDEVQITPVVRRPF